jgi:hypothetical protein
VEVNMAPLAKTKNCPPTSAALKVVDEGENAAEALTSKARQVGEAWLVSRSKLR